MFSHEKSGFPCFIRPRLGQNRLTILHPASSSKKFYSTWSPYLFWLNKIKKKKNIKIDNIYTLLPSWKNEKLINKGWRIGARIKNRSHRSTLEEMTWKVCESISTSYVRSTIYLSPPVELSRLFPQMMEFIRRDTTTIHSCIVHRYLLRWELPRALVHAYA